MGNQKSKESYNEFSNFIVGKSEPMEALGEYRLCTDPETNLKYLLISTTYSITNAELAESELSSLTRINEIKNSA